MDLLKKSLAPITEGAWAEIKEQTDKFLNIYLTGRKFVDIDGPNGPEMAGVSTGHLKVPAKNKVGGVNFGIREFLPLIEVRKPFELDLWELDNIDRGAEDADVDALEQAVRDLALFEEKAIYQGFKDGMIKGLEESAENDPVKLPEDPNEFLNTVSAQVLSLKRDGVKGPYSIVLKDEKWQQLVTLAKGYPVLKQLQDIIQGQVIVNYINENSYLVSEQGGDYELTLGQDISVGYDSHTTEKVKLYLTESFTFRVHSPEAIRILSDK
ncbi:MAG: family 1 encapsulin nanocompartment shell protein [Bacteroidales bacterium]